MTRHDHLVGVLGGMGPAATADFYTKLIRRTPATRDQDHLRVVIWADPTVPDRVAGVIDGSSQPYPAMVAGAMRLRELGATLVAMPCHTAHAFLPDLRADTGLRFLDMVRETVVTLQPPRAPGGSVGLLGSRGTLHSGLYQDQLGRAGLDVVVPPDPTQDRVDLAIREVKLGDAHAAAGHLLGAVATMTELGVSRIVLACTELPLAAAHLPSGGRAEILDPTDLLAAAVVRECLSSEAG
jgi:aspartate racemase